MNKKYNPTLLDAVVSGPGMKYPRKPSVLIGNEGEFIQGDLMDANAVLEAIDDAIGGGGSGSGLSEKLDKEIQDRIDAINLLDSTKVNKTDIATTTTPGLIKLYNSNGANRSGLLLQEDGSLLVNTSADKGLYCDGAGYLHANIEGPATDEDFREAEATNRALTPGNLYAITEWIRNTYIYPANDPYFVGLDEMALIVKENNDAIGLLATVATSGDYNDLENKPTIPAEVTETTVSNWGFTKNTGTYSKPTGGIPISDLSSTVNASLSLANTALQIGDISGKENVTTIIAPVNTTDATLPITALTCAVGKYYRIDVAVNTLAITLPTITDLTTVKTVVIYLTGGTTPAITISSSDSKDVYYQDDFEIEAGSTYEINALFNGDAWVVAAVEINVE